MFKSNFSRFLFRPIRLLVAVALSAVLLLLTLSPMTVNAQSNGLGITPRENFTISAGQQQTGILYLSNLSSTEPLTVAIKVVDFRAANSSGAPQLITAANAPQTSWSIKPFITIPKTASVAAGSSADIPFSIAIPANQGAGSYYSAVEYAAQGIGGQGNIGVAASSASLIFVTVPGRATELMRLVRYGAFIPSANDQTGQYMNWFFTSEPKELAYLLDNEGNVAEQPSGSILLKDFHGKIVRTITNANPNNSLALIGQTRRFEACIKVGQVQINSPNGLKSTQIVCENPKLSPGRYTADLAVYYGLNGNPTQQILATTTFWYIPYWFLIIILVFLGVILYVLYWLIHRIRYHS
jgi:hypothetical protein